MAINWDLWNQAGQKLQNEARELYDFSWVTPELVKGFSRYQALSPEQDVKKANKYRELLENIKDEDLLEYAFNKELEKRKSAEKRTGRKTDEELETELRSEWGMLPENQSDLPEVEIGSPDSERIQRSMADGSYPKHLAGNIPTETPTEEFKTGWDDLKKNYGLDKEALREELFKERYGSDYDDYKRAYDIYGTLNPYEQMIEAGKRSSYWDPEIGKIYTDAGEKIRNDRIAAWKEALEGETMLQNRAMDMYKETKYSRYRKEAEKRLDKITDLLNNNPRKTGKWFEGYDTDPQTDPNVASAYDKIEKKLINEGPLPPQELAALIKENKLQGEDATDLLKQNDDLWAKRYGPEAEATKRTEEAIRAQSETFKKDQTERIKNMNLLDDLRQKLAKNPDDEASYRMAVETLKKLNLDITKSFDEERKKLVETAKKNMVNKPSLKTIGAFLVLAVGDKFGVLPEDLNSITNNDEWKELVRKGVETLYETDLNMYEVERENMEGYLEGVPGIDTSRLSWMQPRRPKTTEETNTVDINALDWSGVTYQTDAVKKQLKAALEGKDSKFKKLENGTYQWVGGTRIQTYDPATGKITQVKRKPGGGDEVEDGGAGNNIDPMNLVNTFNI